MFGMSARVGFFIMLLITVLGMLASAVAPTDDQCEAGTKLIGDDSIRHIVPGRICAQLSDRVLHPAAAPRRNIVA